MRTAILLCVATLLLPAAAALAADPPTKGALKVTVIYGNPVAGVSVKISGPKNDVLKTGDNGMAEFKDLPPGDYTIEAKGIVKNKVRAAKATQTIGDPPAKDPVPVEIKLE